MAFIPGILSDLIMKEVSVLQCLTCFDNELKPEINPQCVKLQQGHNQSSMYVPVFVPERSCDGVPSNRAWDTEAQRYLSARLSTG